MKVFLDEIGFFFSIKNHLIYCLCFYRNKTRTSFENKSMVTVKHLEVSWKNEMIMVIMSLTGLYNICLIELEL